jgi:cyanophycinase
MSGRTVVTPRERRSARIAGAAVGGALAALLTWLLLGPVAAQAPVPVPERLLPAGIDGSLVICGGGKTPDAARRRFLELAGGPKAHLVLIPTASVAADEKDNEKLLEPWKTLQLASLVVLHTRSRETADQPQFIEPLRKATGVWLGGGDQGRLAEAYVGTAVEKELYALLKRGGVIGGTSAGAAVQSRVMIAGGNPVARVARGFDLVPGAVIDQHFLKRDRKARLLGVLEKNPGLVGLGIDEDTALIVRKREMRVVGNGTVAVCLAAGANRPPRKVELQPGAVADLTQWRRAALARTRPPYPPKELPVPEVPRGSQVIVGGGGMPAEVTKKFIELAGGPDAPIIVLPTSMPDPISPKAYGDGFLRKAGAKNVHVLPGRELKDVEDPKNLALLRQARGVWFGGGRQWRFIDAYEGTKAEELFRDVVRRGGVIGGSSAGATIQGDYLCRGSPLGPKEMMCEGYERGFGFLPGVAIDQHFSQRKRFRDMTALMTEYPQFLGIGIDEGTALVVQGHVAEILGRGKVHFYDRTKPVEDGKPDYEAAGAGERYDLSARKVVAPADAR